MAKRAVEKGKALVKSKTFWFNILAVLVAVASLFGYADFVPSENTAGLIATIVAVANIGLRLKTNAPITRIR